MGLDDKDVRRIMGINPRGHPLHKVQDPAGREEVKITR